MLRRDRLLEGDGEKHLRRKQTDNDNETEHLASKKTCHGDDVVRMLSYQMLWLAIVIGSIAPERRAARDGPQRAQRRAGGEDPVAVGLTVLLLCFAILYYTILLYCTVLHYTNLLYGAGAGPAARAAWKTAPLSLSASRGLQTAAGVSASTSS